LGARLIEETAEDRRLNQSTAAPAVDWLDVNGRLVGLLRAGTGGLVVAAVVAGVAASRMAGTWQLWLGLLVAVIGFLAVAAALVTRLAAAPRLQRRGKLLLVRVGPFSVEQLPLDAVECFFLGSQPLDRRGSPTAGDEPAFRVGTLVVRVAERAAQEHAGRWTARGPWAAWEDGYLVIDGRWTEPLTVETMRRVNGRLAQAKRAPVVEGCQSAPSAGGCGA